MNKKYLSLLVFFIGLVACGESQDHETELSENVVEVMTPDSVEILEDIVESKADFIKFDHYATILTKDDLIAQFGKENLVDMTVWYAEGTVERQSTVLTNPDNGHVIKYVWAEKDNFTTSWIEATYYLWDEDYGIGGTQTLESENGLKLGMSLAELRTWNEADFKFSGFEWDYAGGIFEEEGSKLANSKVHVNLINDQIASNEGFDFMIGDVELHADDKNLIDAPVLVEQFSFYIDTE